MDLVGEVSAFNYFSCCTCLIKMDKAILSFFIQQMLEKWSVSAMW